jgi:hypothetical protein
MREKEERDETHGGLDTRLAQRDAAQQHDTLAEAAGWVVVGCTPAAAADAVDILVALGRVLHFKDIHEAPTTALYALKLTSAK